MSAFCVYGVTKKKAMERAEKRVKANEENRDELVLEAFEHLYKTMRPVQISGQFSAPQFAKDFIDLAKKQIDSRSLKVMARDVKRDKHGNKRLSKRTGKPVIGWVPYKA